MDSALSWVGDFVRWVAAWFPRWSIVKPHEVLVKFRRGKRVILYEKHGIVWHWPAFTEVSVIYCGRQYVTLAPQTLMTAEGKTVVATGVVCYKIKDAKTYVVDNWDPDESVAEVCGTALRRAVIRLTVDQVQAGRADVDNRMTAEAQKMVETLGVEVEYMRLVSFAVARVLNIVSATRVLEQDAGRQVQQ